MSTRACPRVTRSVGTSSTGGRGQQGGSQGGNPGSGGGQGSQGQGRPATTGDRDFATGGGSTREKSQGGGKPGSSGSSGQSGTQGGSKGRRGPLVGEAPAQDHRGREADADDQASEGVEEKGYCRETGRCLVEVDPRYFRPTEVDTLLGDPSKAKAKLGWKLEHTFEELVSEMVDADLLRT